MNTLVPAGRVTRHDRGLVLSDTGDTGRPHARNNSRFALHRLIRLEDAP
jgi:hypothetical protein